MHKVSLPLAQARQHWRLASLIPYFVVAFAMVLVILGMSALLALPLWLAVVTAGFFVIAALIDKQWRLSLAETCSKLDARFPELQDSSALLLQAPEQLSSLAQLQRSRTADTLQQLLDADKLKAFRPTRLRSPLLAAIGAGLGLFTYFSLGQLQDMGSAAIQTSAGQRGIEQQPLTELIAEAVTTIEPPAYTNLSRRTQSLDVRAPEGSRITWQVTLQRPAYALRMVAAETEFAFSAQDTLPSRTWNLTRTVFDTDFYQLSLLENKQENVEGNFRLQTE
ncbi:hypothetical protein, partial [Microbulbifer mangrovi]|uniref:hypothetical protein n=1 Tax=Microbulbifer mangrovi TaxID=927787 RepID=UPI00195E2987